jgi:hypothetical protein
LHKVQEATNNPVLSVNEAQELALKVFYGEHKPSDEDNPVRLPQINSAGAARESIKSLENVKVSREVEVLKGKQELREAEALMEKYKSGESPEEVLD